MLSRLFALGTTTLIPTEVFEYQHSTGDMTIASGCPSTGGGFGS